MTQRTSTGNPVPHTPRDWPMITGIAVVACAAVIASFHAQAGLGALAGWHASADILGVRVSLAWLLPLCVDAYGATATRIAVDSARYSEHTRKHALVHAIAAVVVGVLGNAVYHLLAARVVELGSATWVLVVGVSIVPPVALGALAHLIALCARDDAAARVRVVPEGAAAVPEASDSAPALPAAGDVDGWRAFLEELGLPVDQPGPYPGRAVAVPGEVRPGTGVPAYVPGPVPDGAPKVSGEASLGDGQVHLVPRDGPDQVADTGSFDAVPDRSATAEVQQVPAVPEPVELNLKAIKTFSPVLGQGKVPRVQDIKEGLRCGQSKAQQVRAYLAECVTS